MTGIISKPLAALALAAFGIGTTEFVIMGLLPDVARDLGTTIPAAGLLVSGYALGVAFGGPLLAVVLARLPGRTSLLALMALFVLGNIGCALAPSYGWLMTARVVTAFCHAAFFGIGAVIAADLAPPDRRARAIATMISGLTIANVLGVPLGTMIGQASGWRTTFLAVAGIGIVALAALARWVPSVAGSPRNLRAEARVALRPAVLLTLTISVLASTSMFAFFTYITPILTDVAGVSAARVSAVLLACGIGLTIGNMVGARLADWRALPSLAGILVVASTVLVAMRWTLTTPTLATASVVAWGMVAFAVCAILQAEIVSRASDAPNLASTLNISAFNLGNAIGAGLGAAGLSRGLGLADIPLLAAGFALLALALTMIVLRVFAANA